MLHLLRTAAWLFQPVLADRKGLIAVATALTMPVFIGVGALAIDVSFWALYKTQLQRTVDFAAKAGAQRFAATQDARRAADTAADIAELNGARGSASRSWDLVKRHMRTGELDIRVTSGVNQARNTAVHVTMMRKFSVTGLLNVVGSNVTIDATAVAEAHLNSIFNGVIYLPNGELTMGGNVEAKVDAPGGGCLNIIAQYVLFTDQARLTAAGCNALNLPYHGAGAPRADLVR